MSCRWLICIVVSLGIHVVGLWYRDCLGGLPSGQAASPVVVTKVDPAALLVESPPPSSEFQPPETREPEPQIAADAAEKFRPNLEPEKSVEELVPEAEDSPPREQEEVAVDSPVPDSLPAEAALSPEQQKKAIETYRSGLMAQFEEQWQRVPELNTAIEDVTLLPRIDAHFGIVVVAYSFVDHKPGPPFFLFNMQDGSAQKMDHFDFAGFSNRIKDRMLYAQYRSWLDKARRTHGVNSLMKVIGLVPTKADHYFCSKQLRAIQLANVTLDQVRTTNGHYEPGGGGFNLIIDSIVTKNGRTIGVQDEELRFSVVARN